MPLQKHEHSKHIPFCVRAKNSLDCEKDKTAASCCCFNGYLFIYVLFSLYI